MYLLVKASSETWRLCAKRTKQTEGMSSERFSHVFPKEYFDILFPSRCWTFFTRQKMGLRFLKKRKVSPHLQRRGMRNTSVPLIQMFWAGYPQH